MKNKKRFYIWHFFIFLPLLFLINRFEIDKLLDKKSKKPVENTSYELLEEKKYLLYDIVSGNEIGTIEFTEIIPSINMTINFIGTKTSGSRYGYEKVGNHDFEALDVKNITLEKMMNNNEEYWICDSTYKVIMINLFSDALSIPDNIRKKGRKIYLIRFVSEDYFNYIIISDMQRVLRKSLISSSYEGKYSAIFYIDIP